MTRHGIAYYTVQTVSSQRKFLNDVNTPELAMVMLTCKMTVWPRRIACLSCFTLLLSCQSITSALLSICTSHLDRENKMAEHTTMPAPLSWNFFKNQLVCQPFTWGDSTAMTDSQSLTVCQSEITPLLFNQLKSSSSNMLIFLSPSILFVHTVSQHKKNHQRADNASTKKTKQKNKHVTKWYMRNVTMAQILLHLSMQAHLHSNTAASITTCSSLLKSLCVLSAEWSANAKAGNHELRRWWVDCASTQGKMAAHCKNG